MTEASVSGPRAAADRRDAPLTVLFHSDAPYEGGAERYIDYLVDAFPRDWTISVVLAEDSSLDALSERLRRNGARVLRAPRTGAGALRALFGAVRDMTPDVVHLNLPYSYAAQYTAGALAARLAGAGAVVTTEHLTMFPPMRLRGRLRRVLTRYVDRIITLTRSNLEDLAGPHGLDPARIRIVPNGVPEPEPLGDARHAEVRNALGARGEEVVLLHVAALTERKGHRFLFDALGALGNDGWRLVLVGEGEEGDALRARAKALDLDDRIVFMGRREDVSALIGAADVLVLPSRVEGMPLTLLEALACGRPAVTTRIHGVPEIYADSTAAELVDFGDVPALSAALRRLVNEPERRAAMGREARALYASRYTAARMAAETIDVYREALEGRRR